MMWVEKCDNRAVGGMRVRRRDTRIWFVMTAVFFAVFLFTFLKNNFDSTNEVEAANLVNFDPGYIISDYQMSRADAMTEEEIQAFLTAKNPCNNTNQSNYEYLTARYPNLKWHFENGHFVCLSEELFGDGEVIGEGETAAHIIWQAAQDYQINPQVLIVLLQKEQGLITDTYPNSRQYRAATGYGCPDTAACAEKYYGFKNQVRNAAGMFRAVLDGGWTNYPLGENYIQYNPNRDCGGSVVNVRNLATSALYRYTPYQPNAGALTAGYGTAYCGSYGNRNFYHYFEDWFGGITEEAIQEQPDNQIVSGDYYIRSGLNKNFGFAWLDNSIINSSSLDVLVIEGHKNGYYTIKTKDDLYLTIEGDSVVMAQEDDDSKNQYWAIKENNDGTVTIASSVKPSLVLDVKNGDNIDGANIWLYERIGDNNNAQKWIIEEVEVLDISGDYYIVSASFDNRAIDVSNGSRNNGANVQLYEHSENNGAQKWTIEKNTDENYFTITNPQSGKVLDVENGNLQSGSNVQIYELNNSCAQRWTFRYNIDGTYTIRNYCNNELVLDAQSDRMNLQIGSYNNDSLVQRWILKKIEGQSSEEEKFSLKDGVYSIHPLLDENKALDVEGGSSRNMSNVQIFSFWKDNHAQEWEIKKKEDYYIIKNAHSHKAIDVAGGNLSNNTNIWIYEENDSCAQRWKIQYRSSDETYIIANACNEKLVLDVQDYGKNIQLYTGWGDNNTAQRWKIKRIR